MLRARKVGSTLKVVRELDAFPKVPDSYTQSTASGGTVSIISYILIVVLVVSELRQFSSTKFKFLYDVDTDYDSKIKINVDITVGMPCDSIGADVLDVTNQNSLSYGELEEEPVVFELTKEQRIHWDTIQKLNLYIRQQYHAVQELMWKEGYLSLMNSMPARELKDNELPNGCRLHGRLVVNKVSGNFHITAGKHIPHPAGHAHISMFLRDQDYNFSHRIERLSFGDPLKGIFDPLEGDEKIAHNNYQLYQYYVKVVPTEVSMGGKQVTSYQYSVTEQERVINHVAGSHGVPGIYFKYDLSSVKVKVVEEKIPIWHLLVRLCGIIGGIYATSGIVSSLVSLLIDLITCKYVKPLRGQTKEPVVVHTGLAANDTLLPSRTLLASPVTLAASQTEHRRPEI